MIERWLNELYDIDGVEAVIVISNVGKIFNKMSRKLNDNDLEWIALHLLRIIAAHQIKKQDIKDIEIFWENFHIIAKISSKFTLLSICISPRVLSLLRITQNVVLSHMLEDKKFMKLVKKYDSESSIVLHSGKLKETEIKLISELQ